MGKAGLEEAEKIAFSLLLIYPECSGSTLQRRGQKAVACK